MKNKGGHGNRPIWKTLNMKDRKHECLWVKNQQSPLRFPPCMHPGRRPFDLNFQEENGNE